MSTRGLIGFRTTKDRETLNNVYGIYNHYDSYFSGLGTTMAHTYNNLSNTEFKEIFSKKTWETGNSELNYREIDLFEKEKDTLNNDYNFLTDGLFCEYAYLVNLETDELEIYKGVMEKPSYEGQKGYFVKHSNETFYVNCVLILDRNNINELLPLFNNDEIGDYIKENTIK